jgi:hypothetical protein
MCVRSVMKDRKNNLRGPWKKGQSGNPLGRPQGARAKFSETAMAHLLDDWTKHGVAVLERVRAEDPSTYLRVAFGTLPKDVNIAVENRGPLDSEEGRYLRRLVDIIQVAAGDADPMLILNDVEEYLRGRYAKPIATDLQSAAIVDLTTSND